MQQNEAQRLALRAVGVEMFVARAQGLGHPGRTADEVEVEDTAGHGDTVPTGTEGCRPTGDGVTAPTRRPHDAGTLDRGRVSLTDEPNAVQAPDRRQQRLVRGIHSSAPTHTDGMPVRLHHIVVDTYDLPGLARFWTQALGWRVLSEREREIVIGADETAPVGMCFMPVTDPEMVKNRVHLDLTSSAQDRDQEIERLVALGARRVDIGQTGAESWTVLADPEDNEFCVIRPKETLTR